MHPATCAGAAPGRRARAIPSCCREMQSCPLASARRRLDRREMASHLARVSSFSVRSGVCVVAGLPPVALFRYSIKSPPGAT